MSNVVWSLRCWSTHCNFPFKCFHEFLWFTNGRNKPVHRKNKMVPLCLWNYRRNCPWIIIFMHAPGNANPAEVPWFVYAIMGSYFVFFNLFPINMILQYKKVGKWANYLYGERGYIMLSLIAKTVLAWLVFFGVMQPA